MKRVNLLGLALLVFSLAVTVQAQTGMGEISGFVYDEQGAVIPNVTLTIKSPALMGVRTITTSSLGAYRAINLPPGFYSLTASKENYQTVEYADLRVRAGKAASFNITMKVGKFEAVITVTGDAPLLEVKQPTKSWNFSGEFLESLPLSPSNNWNDVMSMIPGVFMGYGGTELVEAHGASYYSNVPLVDGVNVASVQSNYLGDAELPATSISDVQVVAGYAGADKPAGTGSFINVVTKSGGDKFRTSATFDMQRPEWNDSNVDGGSPADSTTYRASASIGGPLIKERIWFFSNFRYSNSVDGIFRSPEDVANLRIFDPNFEPFDTTSENYVWQNKLTSKVTDNLQVVFNYLYNKQEVTNSANRWETESGARGQTYGGPMYSGSFNWVINDKANLQALIGWKEGGFKTRPQGGSGPSVTWYRSTYRSGSGINGQDRLAVTDNITGYNHGNMIRVTSSADFQYYIEDLKGAHELKVGYFMQPFVREERIAHSSNDGFVSEYRVLNDPNDASAGYKPFYRLYYTPEVLSGLNTRSYEYNYYLSDTWRPTDKLVINLGFKSNRAITKDSFDRKNQDSTSYSPSIGATYQLTSDGRNMLRGGFSRNYDTVYNMGQFSTGSYSQGYTRLYDPELDGSWSYTTTRAPVLEPTTASRVYLVDPDLCQPYTDELSLGYQRELPWRVNVDLAYYHREMKNQLGRVEVNGIYDNQGSLTGLKDPEYDLIYMTTNDTTSKFVYDGFEINLHKSLSQKLQFLLGYTYQRMQASGNYNPADPAAYLQPGTFDNDKGLGSIRNSASRYLDSYRVSYYNSGVAPHSFKAAGSYFGPFGINVGVNFVWQQGKWQGAITELIPSSETPFPSTITLPNGNRVTNPIGTRTRFVYATRGEGQERAPSFTYINLKVAKEFLLRERYKIEIAANIFNVFNRGEDMYFNYGANQTNSANYGTMTGRQSPRAGQLNLRLIF